MGKAKPPLVIKKDSNEPKDCYEFAAEYWKGRVMRFRDTLRCGDYTLQGYEEALVIERKRLPDYIKSITATRDNLEAMWQRCTPGSQRWLLLEGDWVMVALFEHQYRSKTHEHSAAGTLFDWQNHYHYNIVPVPNPAIGEKAIYWICREFLRTQAQVRKPIVDHWDYLGKAVDHVLATEAGRNDTSTHRVKRNGEWVRIVRAEEFSDAMTMLQTARAATKGRRGTK